MTAVLPIAASDVELAEHLRDADLPSLLPAIAHLVGDLSLLEDRFRSAPPSPSADSIPQGGLDPATQDDARRRALEALGRYRDAGSPPPPVASEDDLLALIRFVAGDVGKDYLPLLLHELGLEGDVGAPTWTVDELAPGRDLSVVIIGAGMSGIAMAHRLDQAGVPFVVLEKNSEVGGTWWENRYPGCRLDTSNFAYSYSFAQKGNWDFQFSPREEISSYFEQVVEDLDLRGRIRFDVEVVSADFDEDAGRWLLTCREPDGSHSHMTVPVVVSAVGQLNRPSIPDIPGLDTFEGKSFHTADWKDNIDLSGQRVAVIGTGASAYQVIPQIAPEVAALTVFQRTAPWMMPTPHYHDHLPEGLAWLFAHVPLYHQWFRFLQFWNSLEGRRQFMMIDPSWAGEVSVSELNESVRVALAAHIEAQYEDRPDLLAKVMPTYPPYAKRMLRDNGDWARTLKMSHVELVTDDIVEVTSAAVVTADGVKHEVDVIIYGTGFLASDFLRPIDVRGRGGRDLHEWWDGDARAYLGITIPGYPNFFCLYGPNTNLVLNGSITLFSEAGVNYIMGCLEMMLRDGARTMECRRDIFEEFNEMVDAANARMAWSSPGVNSWYKNKFGRVSQNWPLPIIDYWRATRAPIRDEFIVEREAET